MRSLTVFMTLFVILTGVRKSLAVQIDAGVILQDARGECRAPESRTYTTARGDHLNGTDGVLAQFNTTIDELRGANPGVLVPVARVRYDASDPYLNKPVAVSRLQWYLPPRKTITIPASRAALEATAQCERERVVRLERETQLLRAERDDALRQLRGARDEAARLHLFRSFDRRDASRRRNAFAGIGIVAVVVAGIVGLLLGRRSRTAVPAVALQPTARAGLDAAREDMLRDRAHELDQRQFRLANQERHVMDTLAELERDQDAVRRREHELDERQAEHDARNAQLDAKARGLDSREQGFVGWEQRLQDWEQALGRASGTPTGLPGDDDSTRDLSSAAANAVSRAQAADPDPIPVLSPEDAGAESYHSLPPVGAVGQPAAEEPAPAAPNPITMH